MPSRLGLENRKSGVSNQQFITDVMGQVPSPVIAAFIKLSWHGMAWPTDFIHVGYGFQTIFLLRARILISSIFFFILK